MNDEQQYKKINHPMEEVLNIEPGTTLVPYNKQESLLIKHETYDEKDTEIEKQFQDVYDAAMDAFEGHCETTETIDPKYKARNSEVAVQFLNTALNAAKEKASLKHHRDKMTVEEAKASKPGTVNQNLFVGDRNDLLKHLASGNFNENNE